MKYIKKFENLKDEPEVGDYTICISPNFVVNEKLIDFIESNIGRITKMYDVSSLKSKKYYILYDNVPISLEYYFDKNTRIFNEDEIIEFAKTKEDLEIKLQANKYNL